MAYPKLYRHIHRNSLQITLWLCSVFFPYHVTKILIKLLRNLVKQISSPDQNTTAIKRIITNDQRRLFGIKQRTEMGM